MSYSSRPTLNDAIKEWCSMKLGFRCTKRLADLIEEFVMDGDVEVDEWMYSDISIAVRRMLEIFATAQIYTDDGSDGAVKGESLVIRIGPLNDAWRREIKHQEAMGHKVVNIVGQPAGEQIGHEN